MELADATGSAAARRVSTVARLKVVLDDVEPKVTRQLLVPLTMRLSRLHSVLQIVVGWTDSHLWEFRFRDVGYGPPDPDYRDGPLDARFTSLGRAVADSGARSFKYLYDFGDGWSHSIRIEKTEPVTIGLDYPFLLHASGRCPPEDVGGPPGYEEFLAAIANPQHPEHQQMREWFGDSFDPQSVNTAAIDERLAKLSPRGRKTPGTR